MAIILLTCGPYVVIVDYWDRFCTLGRAPRTKETFPDFREWCRVTRHPQLFSRLTGCQRTPRFWGVTILMATSRATGSTSSISSIIGSGYWMLVNKKARDQSRSNRQGNKKLGVL